MHFELSGQQAELLREVLRARRDQLEHELLHTDSREFRRQLRVTIDDVDSVLDQLHLRSETRDAYA